MKKKTLIEETTVKRITGGQLTYSVHYDYVSRKLIIDASLEQKYGSDSEKKFLEELHETLINQTQTLGECFFYIKENEKTAYQIFSLTGDYKNEVIYKIDQLAKLNPLWDEFLNKDCKYYNVDPLRENIVTMLTEWLPALRKEIADILQYERNLANPVYGVSDQVNPFNSWRTLLDHVTTTALEGKHL